jgi:hypothetical protein
MMNLVSQILCHLRKDNDDFRACESLSEIMEAMSGNALLGSHTPRPDFFNKAAISSTAPWRVFATLDLMP